MSIRVVRNDQLDASRRHNLERALADYYRTPPASYYELADQSAGKYSTQETPFHCDLVSRILPAMKILELGCGSAHLCPYVEQRGGIYTGIDYSSAILEENPHRFPRARFLPIDAPIEERFDVVASLYTIEHVVDPPAYLERMWGLCKANGLLAVICPEFVEGTCLPPSFLYGTTPRRLREKVMAFAWLDAFRHLVDLKWKAARWKSRARQAAPGAFWINTEPGELKGMVHGLDTDAVHLATLKDIKNWFQQRGAKLLATSATLPGIRPEVLNYNCYVVARKPRDSIRL